MPTAGFVRLIAGNIAPLPSSTSALADQAAPIQIGLTDVVDFRPI